MDAKGRKSDTFIYDKNKNKNIESNKDKADIKSPRNGNYKQKYCDKQGALLHEKYQICKEIGRGSDGIVKLCKLRKNWIDKNRYIDNDKDIQLDNDGDDVVIDTINVSDASVVRDMLYDGKFGNKNNNNQNNQNNYKQQQQQHLDQQMRAIKIIDKSKIELTHLKDIYNEMHILEQLSKYEHENIVRCYETFESQNKVYIVTELLGGDTLEKRILKQFNPNVPYKQCHVSHNNKGANNGNNFINNEYMYELEQEKKQIGFNEVEMAVIFYQILDGLNYLHNMGIVHRDLKPENILFSKDGVNTVKIIDFGLAGLLTKHNNFKLSHPCGTPFYVAPEVIDPRNKTGQYNEKVDLWSAGVILYCMCCGHLPFYFGSNESLSVLYKQIIKGQVHMTSKNWAYIPNDVRDLVLRLMFIDPNYRLSARQAMDHPWFRRVFWNYIK